MQSLSRQRRYEEAQSLQEACDHLLSVRRSYRSLAEARGLCFAALWPRVGERRRPRGADEPGVGRPAVRGRIASPAALSNKRIGAALARLSARTARTPGAERRPALRGRTAERARHAAGGPALVPRGYYRCEDTFARSAGPRGHRTDGDPPRDRGVQDPFIRAGGPGGPAGRLARLVPDSDPRLQTVATSVLGSWIPLAFITAVRRLRSIFPL